MTRRNKKERPTALSRSSNQPLLIGVMGPTASGKTAFAETIADKLSAKLVSADAFQIYRGMDIGTAKPTRKSEYALVDIRDPNDGFGVGEWVRLTTQELEACFRKRQDAVIVGGTGLYCRALFEGWDSMQGAPDPALRESLEAEIRCNGLEQAFEKLKALNPDLAKGIDRQNPARVRRALERALAPVPAISVELPPFQQVKLGLIVPVAELDQRIAERARTMLRDGWIEEVRSLVDQGVSRDAPGMRAIGYGTVLDLIAGQIGLEEALEGIVRLTRQYAKRQRTWLRSEPRLEWVPSDGWNGWITEISV